MDTFENWTRLDERSGSLNELELSDPQVELVSVESKDSCDSDGTMAVLRHRRFEEVESSTGSMLFPIFAANTPLASIWLDRERCTQP
jgi:hypothetical protein